MPLCRYHNRHRFNVLFVRLPESYDVLRKLIEAKINGEEIHRKVYDNYTESRMKLLGLALSKRLTVLPKYGVSYMYLTKKDLKDNGFQIGDTEGFVNYGLSLGSVHYTAFFTERDNRIRVSFRSKGIVDVNLSRGNTLRVAGTQTPPEHSSTEQWKRP